ncbi:MAG: metallophosphoesterase family protein, partial [Candidatus Heimdallarchaeaceae archaeon]
MKDMKKFLFSILIIISLLVPSITFQSKVTTGKNQETQEFFEMKFDSFNATSPWEFFNESKHPRYPLVARPFGILQYPHKGYPVIAEFNEEFNVVVNTTQSASDWILTIINQNDTVGLTILNSVFKDNMWVHTVLPSEQIVGLYDLQLNCSTGDDYQTHAVKLVEEKTYPFNFVHISDTHFPAYWTDYNTTEINLNEYEKIKALNPDFVIITGDFIQGPSWYFVNPVNGRPMNAEPQLKLALWATDLLNLPVYLIHGNHDYSDSTLMNDRPE